VIAGKIGRSFLSVGGAVVTGIEKYPTIDLVVCVALAAGALGWWLNKAPPSKPETHKAEVVQADKSRVLERIPDSAPAPPPHMIPKGTKEVRRIGFDIQPTGKPSVPVGSPPGTAATCPKVHADVSIAREKDGSARVVASSPDGTVIGGADIPIDWVAQPKEWRYAAGALYNPLDRTYGVFLHRDFSRLRVGAEVFQQRRSGGGAGVGGQVLLGVRW
jgi:hypothetical protein